MKTYEIYKHTAPDGKAYIGQTCNRKQRDSAHKKCKRITPLTTAIETYGWDLFLHETLAENLSKRKANALEIKLIAECETLYPKGLNLHKGGKLEGVSNPNLKNQAYLIDRPLHTRRVKKEIEYVEPIQPKRVRKLSEDFMAQHQAEMMRIPSELIKSAKSNVGGPRGYRK